MKVLKRILVHLAVLVGLIIVVGFLSPREPHVERSTSIKASPEVVFEQINDLRNWELQLHFSLLFEILPFLPVFKPFSKNVHFIQVYVSLILRITTEHFFRLDVLLFTNYLLRAGRFEF